MSIVTTATLVDRSVPLARRVAPAIAAIALLAACARTPAFHPGNACVRNTDCAAPLVCRLGYCRVACRTDRDCDPGLQCVLDDHMLGSCQLQTETNCTLSSDCRDPLVCRFGQCTNECMDDRDCLPGNVCAQEDGGALGCRPESTMQCTLNSDCPDGLICAPDRHCHPPCRDDWDCWDGRVCITDVSPSVCAWPSDGGMSMMDGGVSDASMVGTDAGPSDAGPSDAGPADAGPPMPMPPVSAPHLAAGLQNTCAAPAGRSPRCWGDNTDGQNR